MEYKRLILDIIPIVLLFWAQQQRDLFFFSNTAYKDNHETFTIVLFSTQFQLEIFCCHSGMINLFSNLSKKGWSPVQELEVLVQPACLLWWVISKFCYRLQVQQYIDEPGLIKLKSNDGALVLLLGALCTFSRLPCIIFLFIGYGALAQIIKYKNT